MNQILVEDLYNEKVFYLVQKFTDKEKKQYGVICSLLFLI